MNEDWAHSQYYHDASPFSLIEDAYPFELHHGPDKYSVILHTTSTTSAWFTDYINQI